MAAAEKTPIEKRINDLHDRRGVRRASANFFRSIGSLLTAGSVGFGGYMLVEASQGALTRYGEGQSLLFTSVMAGLGVCALSIANEESREKDSIDAEIMRIETEQTLVAPTEEQFATQTDQQA